MHDSSLTNKLHENNMANKKRWFPTVTNELNRNGACCVNTVLLVLRCTAVFTVLRLLTKMGPQVSHLQPNAHASSDLWAESVVWRGHKKKKKADKLVHQPWRLWNSYCRMLAAGLWNNHIKKGTMDQHALSYSCMLHNSTGFTDSFPWSKPVPN